jgi:hypothetical protein
MFALTEEQPMFQDGPCALVADEIESHRHTSRYLARNKEITHV